MGQRGWEEESNGVTEVSKKDKAHAKGRGWVWIPPRCSLGTIPLTSSRASKSKNKTYPNSWDLHLRHTGGLTIAAWEPQFRAIFCSDGGARRRKPIGAREALWIENAVQVCAGIVHFPGSVVFAVDKKDGDDPDKAVP